ncbi:hypothetical protein [Algoriphagus sp. CAU 1675]|uniref:hypothetical protein n=1 Tax=Algoriphagus sp. CAU 1675 TaxID=3032597 RepID=UPI0023DB4B02|nr:hypothetical protein [Algoriphagus sp. CAU 1675]MDF2156818.1 hypothetical protein [Algoriphagus sp. CAU 1675]
MKNFVVKVIAVLLMMLGYAGSFSDKGSSGIGFNRFDPEGTLFLFFEAFPWWMNVTFILIGMLVFHGNGESVRRWR